MRTGSRLSAAAVMLVAIVTQVAPPSGAVAVADPAGAPADSAARQAAVATATPPSADDLAYLARRVGGNDVRVWARAEAYEISHPRFDLTGVAFRPDDVMGIRHRAGSPSGSRPATSPIAWQRIQSIQALKPCGLRGALVGGLVGTALMASAFGWAAHENEEVGIAGLALLTLPPAGVVVGGMLGAFVTRSETVWPRRQRVREPSLPDGDVEAPWRR